MAFIKDCIDPFKRLLSCVYFMEGFEKPVTIRHTGPPFAFNLTSLIKYDGHICYRSARAVYGVKLIRHNWKYWFSCYQGFGLVVERIQTKGFSKKINNCQQSILEKAEELVSIWPLEFYTVRGALISPDPSTGKIENSLHKMKIWLSYLFSQGELRAK